MLGWYTAAFLYALGGIVTYDAVMHEKPTPRLIISVGWPAIYAYVIAEALCEKLRERMHHG